MSNRPYPAVSHVLRDEYADITELYLLRIVCRTAAGTALRNILRLRTAYARVFGQSWSEKYTEGEIAVLLELRLQELEAAPPDRNGPLFNNVKLLANRLGLGEAEQAMLAFRVMVRTCEELEDTLKSLGALSESRLVSILSLALSINQREIEEGLHTHNPLIGSGLMGKDQMLRPFLEKLPLTPGLANALLKDHESLEDLISFAAHRAEPPALGSDDYPHLREEIALVCRYLEAATRRQLAGVNILIYGTPGVGKTQLARAISHQLGLALYEVAASGQTEEALNPSGRYDCYRLNQRLFANEQKTMILFDEVEDALLNLPTFEPLSGMQRRHSKAWINRLLEHNPVPTFWVANSVEFIDPAILRRFDYVLEVRNPPRSVRLRILREVLNGVTVPQPWLDDQAQDERMSPALAERAARIVKTAGILDMETAGKQFRQIVENSLAAQGHGARPRYPQSEHYSLEFVNAGRTDLALLRSNLAKRARGRLLLYGPPGSGKTAFAHHLASELDRPLLLKRASDLVSKWLGETEKNLARMFKNAADDEAVLLLDEADSFLQDRQKAVRSWEVTEVNELLTQMECFEGLFLCATNFRENLDSAALRRFGLKIRFDYLYAEQSWLMFVRTLTALGGSSPAKSDAARIKQELSALRNLTPGDFNAAKQQFELMGKAISVDGLLEALQQESLFKPDSNRRPIGF